MIEIFTAENIGTLLMLTMLQAVLGFDNLLYISLESKRAPLDQQTKVRKLGIGLAVLLRIVLLFVLVEAISSFQEPFLEIQVAGVFGTELNFHALIVLFGGVFIIYTAVKEIYHMMYLEVGDHGQSGKKSVGEVIIMIGIMNLIFSFDSILSAIALTDVMPVMIASILISGALMVLLADNVSEFLKRNRMYEVLGLFILFIVGIMLLSEGGHLAHLTLFGYEVEPMSKSTFYFVIAVLVVVDFVQSRYQKRLISAAQDYKN